MKCDTAQKFFLENSLLQVLDYFPKFPGYWLPLSILIKFLNTKGMVEINIDSKTIFIPIDISDPFQLDIFMRNKNEHMIPYIISKLLADDGKLFDVGANCGWVSRIVSALKPSSRIVAIEPSIKAFEYLIQMRSENTLALCIAISDKNKKLNSDRRIYRQIATSAYLDSDRGVSAITLDRLAEFIGFVPQIIKIDVEGAELNVLKGASELLKLVCYIIVEVNNNEVCSKFNYSYATIFEYLNSYGFLHKYEIINATNQLREINEVKTGDILFSKKDIKEMFFP